MYVSVDKIIDKMKLKNLTPDIDTTQIHVNQADVNRPALQLAGFFDYFDSERVQIMGKVEFSYLSYKAEDERKKIVDKLMSSQIPCIVISRGMNAFPEMIELGNKYGIPILSTTKSTSSIMAEVIRWLKVELAPSQSIHGVLVDVFGEGVLIMGESGIGKSETALELIKRGHRLVADDVVEIKKVSDETLIGSSPDIIRHFIELRGIGIIDVKTLFGVESVKDINSIDFVIQLEDWVPGKEYDRLGLKDEYIDILGNKVICNSLPIRPGRNLAIIVESAAINHRQKKMGYNAAVELNNRVMGNILKRQEERAEENNNM